MLGTRGVWNWTTGRERGSPHTSGGYLHGGKIGRSHSRASKASLRRRWNGRSTPLGQRRAVAGRHGVVARAVHVESCKAGGRVDNTYGVAEWHP